MTLITKIDYNTMTEEEFLLFLDQEAKRIREQNLIVPLSPRIEKFARVASDNLPD